MFQLSKDHHFNNDYELVKIYLERLWEWYDANDHNCLNIKELGHGIRMFLSHFFKKNSNLKFFGG